jgi:alpha-1,6-mannosyltransferase
VAAFCAYLAGLAVLRRHVVPVRPVAVLDVAVQLVPLGAPLLLSTDAWAYWAYGWIGTNGGDPYADEPSAFPASPAYPYMGDAWRDTTSVYGPAFTLATEPLALVAGDSANAAAWTYKALGAAAMAAAALLAARIARRRALAVAFVGWNPVVAVHAGGGGHNDAWVAAALAAALALGAARRPAAAGASWALAVLLKWVPLLFLALHVLAARSGARRPSSAPFVVGGVAATAAVAILACWRFGLDWLAVVVPLAGNAALETSYALPARLQQLGVPEAAALVLAGAAFAAGVVALGRKAHRDGQACLGRAACLVLLTTPYLIVWYLAWAVTLAAADEDRIGRAGVLVLSAYLLPQTIPL